MAEYEIVAEMVGTASAPTHISGTQVIKTLWLPDGKQSGDFRVLMSFDTPNPGSVWADLIDRDAKKLWRGPIMEPYGFDVITEFNVPVPQLGFSVRRWESGNLALTLTRFIIYRSTVAPPPPPSEPKGIITLCQINNRSCPDAGTAPPNQEISVIMEMRNDGADGEFRFYVKDQHGTELSKEPDLTYKNVKSGETWRVEKSITQNLNFTMPGYNIINGKVELYKQI